MDASHPGAIDGHSEEADDLVAQTDSQADNQADGQQGTAQVERHREEVAVTSAARPARGHPCAGTVSSQRYDINSVHVNTTESPRGRLLDLWGISDESFEVLASTLSPPLESSDSAHLTMLGDRLLPDADFVVTFESRSEASASRLWPWVAQAMRGGGIYGWSRLDSPVSRPADRLLDGLPSPRVGDRLGDLLEICRLDRHAEIVWRNPEPLTLVDSVLHHLTLDYRVDAIRSGGARLVARLRCVVGGRSRPMANFAATTLAYILPYCQVRNLTQRADLVGQVKRVRCETTMPFQHLGLTPARPSRRQGS